MEKLKKHFEQYDRFAKLCGIELLEVGSGKSKARMKIREQHLNGVGTVHGGAIFTLADFAFALAGNSSGKVAVAVNVSISFMKAVSNGFLTAQAWEVTKNPKLGTYTVEIKDDADDVVAIFQGLAYRKKEDFESLIAKGPIQ
ncbi:MAG TPA: PaaI family thioesterase [Sedimentisphaerales bacterium]|nr:PaaI family thioesterase [Sedimentisphaerales bacterium]